MPVVDELTKLKEDLAILEQEVENARQWISHRLNHYRPRSRTKEGRMRERFDRLREMQRSTGLKRKERAIKEIKERIKELEGDDGWYRGDSS
jgi:hypothetical protein